MHLLASLQSGFADAPSGSARIYRRGTTTSATCYTDFKGTVTTTTHALDSRGRVRRYVNELVDIKVFDVAGNQVVETFTEGVNATAVEIIHSHVTGTDYDTAASGLNKPSTLQIDFDRRYTSFGADNSQVLVGGSARNLKDVLLTGFIDVKGPTYGAKGDAATDDTVAIQAAITAAVAAGGGTVLFPPGTYIVSSLSVPSNVSLLGSGSGTTIIQTSSAGEVLLVAGGAFLAYGLQFKTTGKGLLRFTAATGTTIFTSCAFVCTNATTVDAVNASGCDPYPVVMNGCDVTQTGAGGTKALLGYGIAFTGGTITFVSGTVVQGRFHMSGVLVKYTGATTVTLIDNSLSDARGNIVGCAWSCTGAGALQLNMQSGTYESGSLFVGGNITFTLAGSGDGFRVGNSNIVNTAAITYAPNALFYAHHFVVSSGASFQWAAVSPAFSGEAGRRLTLWYQNNTAGPITPTFAAGYYASAVAVGAGKMCGWLLEWNPGFSAFVQLGSPVSY